MNNGQKKGSAEDYQCEALVIGGGIAGCWTALKLAERGIHTLLVFYEGTDRGGRLGSTALSVGAINTAPLLRDDYASWLEDLGRGQVHPSVAQVTADFIEEEIAALQQFDPLKKIELGLALASGSAKVLLNKLLAHLESLGVVILRTAWVVRLEASESCCQGIQYQTGDRMGSVAAGSIVIASGGYSGLFQGAVKSGTFGSMHARFLAAGGKLSNLEFIFKHGYGQPDLGKLTPTEELPGAEIYDQQGTHLLWLEEELFNGRGTHNHFQAFMTWRKADNKKYFVDFRYCAFHRALKKYLREANQSADQKSDSSDAQQLATQAEIFHEFVAEEFREEFHRWLSDVVNGLQPYSFAQFQAIKPWLLAMCPENKHHIRQIAYFSMGGIMHHGFLTNLKNVYVNGEAMHDYGAHRVGGLPWALYLCAARKIAEDIVAVKSRSGLASKGVQLIMAESRFDAALLTEIQTRMLALENGKSETELAELANWLNAERKNIPVAERIHHDGYAYLLLAEAIVQSAIARKESRGTFFRPDFIREDYRLDRSRTVAWYDSALDEVKTDCIDKTQIFDLVYKRVGSAEQLDGSKDKYNAAYFLAKKHLATERAQATAIVQGKQRLSYEDLNRLVGQYAFFLFSQGLVRGDRVAIHLRDSADWIALFLATLQLGLVVVPLNTFAKESDILFFLDDTQAEIFISERALLSGLNLEILSQRKATRLLSLEDIQPLGAEISCCLPVAKTTPAFILYTSGSTGLPKGALHSHGDLEFTAQHFAQLKLQPHPGDIFYSSSRLYFAYGLGNSLTFPLYFGCTCVVTAGKLSEAATVELIRQEKVTHFFSIPAIYAKMVDQTGADAELPSLKICVSAGEPLAPALARKWVAKTNRPLMDGLGSTEALHIFCYSQFNPDGSCTLGQPVKGYELRLLDDNNFLQNKINTVGNLAVTGGSLASGYWNNPAATQQTFINNLLLTGDRFSLNENGEFIYFGRSGDSYKVAGLWVSAVEIEMLLKELDYVQEAAQVAFLTAAGEQKTAAFVVVKSNAAFPEEQRIKHIIAEIFTDLTKLISRYKIPDHIFVCNELPRTATGKVIKSELKAQAAIYLQQENRESAQNVSAQADLEVS